MHCWCIVFLMWCCCSFHSLFILVFFSDHFRWHFIHSVVTVLCVSGQLLWLLKLYYSAIIISYNVFQWPMLFQIISYVCVCVNINSSYTAWLWPSSLLWLFCGWPNTVMSMAILCLTKWPVTCELSDLLQCVWWPWSCWCLKWTVYSNVVAVCPQ